MDFAINQEWSRLNPDSISPDRRRSVYTAGEKLAWLLEEKYRIKIPEDRGVGEVLNRPPELRPIDVPVKCVDRSDRPELYIEVDFDECGIPEERHEEAVEFLKKQGYVPLEDSVEDKGNP